MSSPDRFEFTCPICGLHGAAPSNFIGKIAVCPKCKGEVIVYVDGSYVHCILSVGTEMIEEAKGMIINWIKSEQLELLSVAGMKMFIPMVKGNLNFRGPYGLTALHCAALNGNIPVAKLLLQNNADINVAAGAADSEQWKGFTPLHFAAEGNQKEFTEYLLKCGADVGGHESKYGMTPLDTAAAFGHEEVVRSLVAGGADVSGQDFKGRTPLHTVADEGHVNVATFLLESGARIEATDSFGFTPLHIAVDCGRREVATFLIESGANVKATNNHGVTPLHFAAGKGDEVLANLLLERGAEIDSVAQSGVTPLHVAGDYNQASMVSFLLSQRADIGAKDDNGITALELAQRNGKHDVAKVLISFAKGGKSRTKDKRAAEPQTEEDNPFVADVVEPVDELRKAIRNALSRGTMTPRKKTILRNLAQRLEIPNDVAAQIFQEEKSSFESRPNRNDDS